jgi:hypothetical protein
MPQNNFKPTRKALLRLWFTMHRDTFRVAGIFAALAVLGICYLVFDAPQNRGYHLGTISRVQTVIKDEDLPSRKHWITFDEDTLPSPTIIDSIAPQNKGARVCAARVQYPLTNRTRWIVTRLSNCTNLSSDTTKPAL